MSERIRVWVQKFKDRRYPMLQWYDPETGKRCSQSARTDDPEAIEDARADLESDLNNGRFNEPCKMPWEKFREVYLREEGTGRTEKGISKINSAFNALEDLVKPKTLGGVTERTISRFITEMRTRGNSPSTIKGYLAHIKASLRWAERQKMIPKAPHVEMPNVPKNTNKARINKAARITDKHLQQLRDACPNRGWELLVMLGWHCGLRRTEAREVRGEHINLESHLLSIPSNKANDLAASAVIPPELEAYLRGRWPDGIPDGKLIHDSQVPGSQNQVSKRFALLAQASGVPGNSKDGFITFHDLRRVFGSRWAKRAPAQILQRLMRHSHISVTMDYYADTDDAAVALVCGGNPS